MSDNEDLQQVLVVLTSKLDQLNNLSDQQREQLREIGKELGRRIIVITRLPTQGYRLFVDRVAIAIAYQEAESFIAGLPVEVHIDGGQVFQGLRTAELSMSNLNHKAKVIAEEFRLFAHECDKINSIPVVPKPWQQRKFHTVPGSRQDKYSRSKR